MRALHVTASMLERKFWNSGYPEKGLEERCWKDTPHCPGGLLAMHVGIAGEELAILPGFKLILPGSKDLGSMSCNSPPPPPRWKWSLCLISMSPVLFGTQQICFVLVSIIK